ncbi:MAG TPA: serine/threonine-protein kinase, partial [Polyangiaceae bacterium]|nr:serine/threonine-protein kinase [Polyangiaceae bacterium]
MQDTSEVPLSASSPLPEANPVSSCSVGPANLVGTKIRGWRLVRLLGVGPVSAAYEVYAGEGPGGQHAVLKLCTMADKDAQSFFLRAVYAANRFRHPRVIPIIADGADEQGAPFVIRPWLEVRSLADAVAERELRENQVLRIAEQLLDAIEMAHAHGITHGALTPHNLLLTPNGSIRLCDFAMTPGADRFAALRAGPFTAPERRITSQACHARGTEQGDVWSVGACLYFALSKKPPPTVDAGPLDLSRELPQTAKAVRAILEHALHADPIQRYESAYAMLGDVRRAMSGRAPKLSLAAKPIPSGGYRAMPGLTPPLGQPVDDALLRIGHPSMTDEARREQWRGNAALILAIVTLLGV